MVLGGPQNSSKSPLEPVWDCIGLIRPTNPVSEPLLGSRHYRMIRMAVLVSSCNHPRDQDKPSSKELLMYLKPLKWLSL